MLGLALTEGLSNHARRAAATPGARAARSERKKHLAAKSGIDLIALTENDLGCLERVFARWIDES